MKMHVLLSAVDDPRPGFSAQGKDCLKLLNRGRLPASGIMFDHVGGRQLISHL